MALITSYSVEKNRNSMAGLSAYENGGKGSGNFGHSGRPGEVGGSGDGNGSDSKNNKEKPNKSDYISQLDDKHQKLVRDALKEAGIEGEDLERAMDSKLVDLEDTIDIDEIIKEEKNSLEKTLTDAIMKILNGGKGSGNFNHDGRPGEVGGSAPSGSGGGSAGKKSKESRTRDAIAKAIAGQKKLQDKAKVVREDIEDRIGQKVKEGEEYTALDEAHKSRFKVFHGEDGTEYTYDKENGMITKTNPKTGEEEVVTKQGKDYGAESHSVAMRDGSAIRSEYADLAAHLETARTNLKTLKEEPEKAYDDLAGRSTYLTRSSSISSALHLAQTMSRSKMSAETKALVKEMETELKKIDDEYSKLGTKKYFNPDLNHENQLEHIEVLLNGGKGSGNFGHEGRPGEVGGSAPTGGHGGSSDTKKTNPREGYGSRFAQAKIDDDDFVLRTDDKKTMLSRIDEDTVRDTIAIRAVAKQMGEQMWQGKLDDITDELTGDYAKVQRHLAHQMDLITDEILDGATRRAAHYDPSEKDADAKMARFERDYKAYDAALTKYGDQVYQGANEKQAKMLKDNDKVLMKAHEKLGEAYRKFKAAEGEPTITVDISDLVKPRR